MQKSANWPKSSPPRVFETMAGSEVAELWCASKTGITSTKSHREGLLSHTHFHASMKVANHTPIKWVRPSRAFHSQHTTLCLPLARCAAGVRGVGSWAPGPGPSLGRGNSAPTTRGGRKKWKSIIFFAFSFSLILLEFTFASPPLCALPTTVEGFSLIFTANECVTGQVPQLRGKTGTTSPRARAWFSTPHPLPPWPRRGRAVRGGFFLRHPKFCWQN